MDLDHNLKFDQHTDLVATRAIASTAALHNLLNESGGVRRELAVNLYKAFVLPHIEYAYPVWSTATRTAQSKIERFQRIALIKATGSLNSTPTNALEVISGCMPLNLRLKETLAQEYARIMRKPDGSLVKQSLQLSLSHPFTPGIPMSAHLIHAAFRPTSRHITMDQVEAEPSPLISFTSPITTRHITDKTLGSSATRTREQILLARSATTAHLARLPPSTLIVFTDGSALRNPGPCGASAVVYTHGLGKQPTVLQRPVSRHSSSYHAELNAIDLALEYSTTLTNTHKQFNTVSIHTDCQSVIATLLNGMPNGFHQTVDKIHTQVKDLKTAGIQVAGHAGLTANELADTAAKEAASHQGHYISHSQVSMPEVKAMIRTQTIAAWQAAWRTQHQGRFTYDLFPHVKTTSLGYKVSRKTDIKLNRIRSGHTLLAEHAFRMGLSSTNSQLCECGLDTGTIGHFLFHCPLHTQSRERLVAEIERGYITTSTPPHLRTLNTSTLIGSNEELPKDMRLCIHRAVAGFLSSCNIPL